MSNLFVDTLQKRPLLLDGPMGTELERRGVVTSGVAWTSRANLMHADLVTAIHREYIAAGADIITTNTFRTNPRAHRVTGLDARELTMRAVELAHDARLIVCNKELFIAGSIAPVGDSFTPDQAPISDSELFEEHALMASWLEEAGVDLVLIETMNTFREAYAALQAVLTVTKLPAVVSLVALDSTHTLSGMPLVESLRLLAKTGATAIGINCTQLSIMRAAFDEISRLGAESNVPIALYANAAEKRADGSWDLCASSDAELAQASAEWVQSGVRIIGTCCGATPLATELLRKAIDKESHTTSAA